MKVSGGRYITLPITTGQHLYSDSDESDSFAGEDLFSRSQFGPGRHQPRPLPFMFPPPPPGPPPGDSELYRQCKSHLEDRQDRNWHSVQIYVIFQFFFFLLVFLCMHLLYSFSILSIYNFFVPPAPLPNCNVFIGCLNVSSLMFSFCHF